MKVKFQYGYTEAPINVGTSSNDGYIAMAPNLSGGNISANTLALLMQAQGYQLVQLADLDAHTGYYLKVYPQQLVQLGSGTALTMPTGKKNPWILFDSAPNVTHYGLDFLISPANCLNGIISVYVTYYFDVCGQR